MADRVAIDDWAPLWNHGGAPRPEGCMSEEEAISYTANTGEWWWIAGYLMTTALRTATTRTSGRYPDIEWKETPLPSGTTIEGLMEGERILFLSVTATKTQTFISVSARFPLERFWKPILETCQTIEQQAREMRRTALSRRYELILDEYYQRRRRLESPNLRQMADENNVSYGSLRQFKISYDKRLKELLGETSE